MKRNYLPVVAIIGLVLSGILTGVFIGIVFADSGGEDNEFLYAAIGNNVSKIDPSDGSIIWNGTNHTNSVRAVVTDPASEHIWSGSFDDTLKKWGADGNVVLDIPQSEHGINNVRGVTITDDGETVYIVGNDGDYSAVDKEGNVLFQETHGSEHLLSVDVGPNNETLYVGGRNDQIAAINLSDHTTEWTSTGGTNLQSLTVANDGLKVFAGYSSNDLQAVWAANGTTIWTDSFGSAVEIVGHNQGKNITYAGESNTVHAFHDNNGTEIWNESTTLTNRPFSFAASDQFEHVYLGDLDDDIASFDSEDGQVFWENTSYNNDINSLAISSPAVGEDEQLKFEVNKFMVWNTSLPYTVRHFDGTKWNDVTENASITVENTSVIVWNESAKKLEGQKVNDSTNVTAEFGGLSQTKEITVAVPNLENLALLPPSYRVYASATDSGIQIILVALIAGSVIAFTTGDARAGMAITEAVLLVGWQLDMVSTGIIIASIIFIFLMVIVAKGLVTSGHVSKRFG